MIKTQITCDSCGMVIITRCKNPPTIGDKVGLALDEGWIVDLKGKSYCPICTPVELRPKSGRHPHYYDYYDSWGNPPEPAG